jgi:hypothetical protein
VDRPHYTKQEYLSLARNHQAACITYNVGRTAANPPFLWTLDAPCKLLPIPPSTRNTEASGVRARGVPTGRKCFLGGVRTSSDTPSTRNNYKVSPITEGKRLRHSVVHNKPRFIYPPCKDSQGLFKVAGLAEGGSNSANVDRRPSRRSNRLLSKNRNSPVARGGLVQCRSSRQFVLRSDIYTTKRSGRRTQKLIAVTEDRYKGRDVVGTQNVDESKTTI